MIVVKRIVCIVMLSALLCFMVFAVDEKRKGPTPVGIDSVVLDFEIGGADQGRAGDCWLLAAINALSAKPFGKVVLKGLYADEGDTVRVDLKGAGVYVIDKQDIVRSRFVYSHGDDDMIVLELAVARALAEYRDGKIEIPFLDEVGTRQHYRQAYEVNSGVCPAAFYLLTGEESEDVDTWDDVEKIRTLLQRFQESESCFLCAATSTKMETIHTHDVDGERIHIPGKHAYSIIGLEGDSLEILNPHDADSPFWISIDAFSKAFVRMTICDLQNIDE